MSCYGAEAFSAMLSGDQIAVSGALVEIDAYIAVTKKEGTSHYYRKSGDGDGKGHLIYLVCRQNLEIALKEVEKRGGKVLEGAKPVAPYGNRAIIVDLDGNTIALHTV